MNAQTLFLSCRRGWVIAVTVMLLAAGAGLRLWQVCADKSLWVDEIALARNFSRPVQQLLTTPLGFGQVAPRGFVLAEKLTVTWFGWSDFSLRLVPLISALAALLLFWRIAVRVCGRRDALVALALFAAAAPLVIYSGQVKQYSTDALVAVALALMALWSSPATWSWRRAAGVGIGGCIAAFFSHSAVILLIGLGGALALLDFFEPKTARRSFRPFVLALVLWMIAALAGALMSMGTLSSGGQVFMPRYWARGFPPGSFDEWFAALWPWQPFRDLMRGGDLVSLGYHSPAACLGLVVLGAVWIGRRNVRHLVLVTAPIAAALAAAVLRQYPFSDRLSLFLIPFFLLLLAAGILLVGDLLARLWRPLGFMVVIYLTGTGLAPIIKSPPPYGMEDARPLLAYLEARRRPNDAIYVFSGAWQALQFYGPRYGLSEADYFSGDCYRGAPRKYLEEADGFRGRDRVWLILIHTSGPYRERQDIVGYLDAIGARRDYFVAPSRYFQRRADPSELFLFDLSDPERLERTSSASFPVTGPDWIDPRWPCGIHVRPVKPSRWNTKNS